MKLMDFSITYRYGDILFEKKYTSTSFITVCFATITMYVWPGLLFLNLFD